MRSPLNSPGREDSLKSLGAQETPKAQRLAQAIERIDHTTEALLALKAEITLGPERAPTPEPQITPTSLAGVLAEGASIIDAKVAEQQCIISDIRELIS